MLGMSVTRRTITGKGMCACTHVCVCVRVCESLRERERKREKETERGRRRSRLLDTLTRHRYNDVAIENSAIVLPTRSVSSWQRV